MTTTTIIWALILLLFGANGDAPNGKEIAASVKEKYRNITNHR
jgi:hypothetical protein